MQLGDIDWHAGEVNVRGKAGRRDCLPLPVEVGEALVAYLTDGRPHCPHPEVFLTLYAPHRPIMSRITENVGPRSLKM